MRHLFTSFLLTLFFCVKAQINMTIHSGLSYAYTPDQVLAPKGTGFAGYLLGGDVRLLDDGLCFMFTGDYGRFNLSPNNKYQFFSNHSLSYYKAKFGVGYDLYDFTPKVNPRKMTKPRTLKLRSKIQGNLTYINKFDPQQVAGGSAFLKETGYIELNESIAGISSGIGLTIGSIDFDLEYEYGFFNIYFTRKESKLNFINFYTGFRF
jgi:hypothetical protein